MQGAGEGEAMDVHRVVVGVDGSPNSVAALRRAVMQAHRREAVVEVVHVVDGETDPGARDTALDAGRRLIAGVVAKTFPDGPQVIVRARVECGEPAPVLVRASEGADLLVIGAREHSGYGNLFGGVTVPGCLDHARCPVDVCADHAECTP
jgi:nucleotide-binding universal stress UspA family protein